ncbi:DUF6931 family protein [Chelatococcus sp. GCM10030263]|uniref:DUF6931 family protein n=1 Tax=Chelatococcus sp. GCM10030263 TaxID=3273387 RepID=UPI0036205F32
MNFERLVKIEESSAKDIATVADLSREAQMLLREGEQGSAAFLARLVGGSLWTDAIRVFAFALPRREGVWWACLSARRMLTRAGAEMDRVPSLAAIEAAETWVRRPCEDTRRPVFALAEVAGFDTPAGYAALAAFWTGNLSRPDLPEIAPDPSLAPVAIGAAVLLAAVDAERGPDPALYRAALAEALDIARGGDGRAVAPPSEARAPS